MSTASTASPIPREPELLGQTVVVIGASAGIGLETARHAENRTHILRTDAEVTRVLISRMMSSIASRG